jgi:hypothetical protein
MFGVDERLVFAAITLLFLVAAFAFIYLIGDREIRRIRDQLELQRELREITGRQERRLLHQRDALEAFGRESEDLFRPTAYGTDTDGIGR